MYSPENLGKCVCSCCCPSHVEELLAKTDSDGVGGGEGRRGLNDEGLEDSWFAPHSPSVCVFLVSICISLYIHTIMEICKAPTLRLNIYMYSENVGKCVCSCDCPSHVEKLLVKTET